MSSNDWTYKPKSGPRPPIIPGILLVLVGLWLLGRQLQLPGFVEDIVWPWLIIALGVVIWLRYILFPPRSPDDVFWGTAALLSGAFLLVWRNGLLFPEAAGWGTLWPIIPLIAGISTLVKWVFHIRDWGALVFGTAAGAVGVVGLGYTLGAISSKDAWAIAQYWPLLVILGGLGLLIQAILGRRPNL